MSLNYNTLTQAYAGWPILVSHGPAETGKTTAIKAALSLTGEVQHTTYMNRLLLQCFCFLAHSSHAAMYVKGTNAFFLERAAISSLPFAIDDPP